jgi:hypothetical protein
VSVRKGEVGKRVNECVRQESVHHQRNGSYRTNSVDEIRSPPTTVLTSLLGLTLDPDSTGSCKLNLAQSTALSFSTSSTTSSLPPTLPVFTPLPTTVLRSVSELIWQSSIADFGLESDWGTREGAGAFFRRIFGIFSINS